VKARPGEPKDPRLLQAFHRLTPDKVAEAVELGGRRCTGRFMVLNSYENRVYQLEIEGGRYVVAKFYRPGRWSDDCILDEHDFLMDLEEMEIPVAAPLDLGDGETLAQWEGIRYALFPRIGGRSPEEMDDEQLRTLGRYLARIHAVGAREDAPQRPRASPRAWLHEPRELLLRERLVPPDVAARWSRCVDALLQLCEPLWEGVALRRIHGDCHLGNLLWSSQGLVFLDFDDCVVGPPVQDLWMLYGGRDAWAMRRRDVLLEGYETFGEFPWGTLRLVEPLRAMRMVQHAAWLARRRDDPAFQQAFPDFGSPSWWQAELRDLQGQLDVVRESLDASG
jgi:Ser/Thr protein kinase RdoA (MazF antagonist)